MRNLYNYFFDNATNTFNFTTQNNIDYKIIFIVDETFSSFSAKPISNTYQLVVEKTSDILEPFDANVSRTIVQIIEVFFQNVQNALIYICDDKDEKALLRHAIFDRWYQNSNNKNQIIKVDNVIRFNIATIEPKTLYTSLLLSRHNQNFNQLIDIYNRMEEILNEDK